MATINFVNNTLIAGTTANPGLEDVLSATGAITANTASLFEITNTGGGQFNGFRFQLTSSGRTSPIAARRRPAGPSTASSCLRPTASPTSSRWPASAAGSPIRVWWTSSIR